MTHDSPALLPSIPPALSEQLKHRTNQLRSRIARANYNTQFARTVPDLSEFRHALAGLVDHGADDGILSETFLKTVPLMRYDAYAPFIARFSENPCKANAVIDLLAPGFPDFLVESSSTSGGCAKVIPKYNRRAKIRASDPGSWTISDPSRKRTNARIFFFAVDPVEVVDEDDCPVATIYESSGTSVVQRVDLCLDPERDEEKMGVFVLDNVAPYAAGFIKKWPSFLLIQGLFVVSSRSLETMSMIFISTFVDLIRLLDSEFDTVVDCVANGTIPDLDGIAKVRHYLEMSVSPDPERAEELRGLGRPSSQPGWCGRVWPNLRSVASISSGSFASSVPLARWFLGPNAELHAFAYGSSEACLGLPYNPVELNLFKPTHGDVIEFLDVSKSESTSSLAQLWEVEPGRRYEVVVTSQDGLWRYRLGDVIEIAGFDPRDGDPIIQFVERRNVAVRFPDCMISEEELRMAMTSLSTNILTKVVDWTVTIDERCIPATVGFFVELADDRVSASDLALAPDCVFDALLRPGNSVAYAVAHDSFRKPTIRLVRTGTFRDFRQLKYDAGSKTFGQVKVPVVLSKAEHVTWISDRVVREL